MFGMFQTMKRMITQQLESERRVRHARLTFCRLSQKIYRLETRFNDLGTQTQEGIDVFHYDSLTTHVQSLACTLDIK
jgi:hypothetical protein